MSRRKTFPSEIFQFARDLESAHEAGLQFDPLSPAYDEAADIANCNLHWRLREQIEATTARSIEALKVKACAAELALARDPDAECDGAGSFIALSRSMIRDIQALSAGKI